jgi:predicted glycosyltransferase
VYGDINVFNVAEAYRLPPEITAKLHYVGYIARPGCACPTPSGNNGDGVRRVLVTVGGGTDGHRLIDQYLTDPVERVGALDVHTTIVGGPDLPRSAAEQFRRRAAAFRNVVWRDVLPCMCCEYKRSNVILTMGGYNAMIEVLQSGRPMLVYPRVEPRLEQYIRTRKFASLQLCEGLDPNCVTPARIRAAVERLLVHGAATPTYRPALDGLDNVTLRLSQMEAVLRDSLALCV